MLSRRIRPTLKLTPKFSKRCWSASPSLGAPAVLGILRETYHVWERRTPLCPHHVKQLLSSPLVKDILVQPSSSRVFSDKEYEQAGATMQNDLSSANLILGVKRPLKPESLHPQKAYMFFSHVIKGQPENMPLLKYILKNHIRLFDYELIVDGGMEDTKGCKGDRKPKRLVAFGQFAGRAGMTDAFNPLGRRLLALGFSTPFLHCPPAHMQSDWDAVQATVRRVGERIATNGLPAAMHPIIFCFTGRGGNVCNGAMEVFNMLPHEMISVEDLPYITKRKGSQTCVYGLALGTGDVFRRKDTGRFGRNDYKENPADYESIFAKTIAPYINVLVNGMYWDERYPRILTKNEMKDLYTSGNKKLLLVLDISCDVNGSIEFLERTTSVDHPYFQYDPVLETVVSESISGEGVTVMGVDILPTELPRESSEHFGDKLMPVLQKYIAAKDQECYGPPELTNACIADKGLLTPTFSHLDSFLQRPSGIVPPAESKSTLWMEGHLFDTGFINHVLDIIEQNDCTFEIVKCHVRRKHDGVARKSHVIVRIGAPEKTNISRIENQIRSLMDVMESTECVMKRLDHDASSDMDAYTTSVKDLPKQENILVLGAGLVSKPLVEYLGRDSRRFITVVGDREDEARSVSQAAKNGRHMVMDVHNQLDRVAELVEKSDIVISLLPAPLHAEIAKICIDKSIDLVTASYESDDMRQLHERAKASGVRLLNEVGLDPGLDHMTAMKMIDFIHENGGTVTGFSSVCGGLPAPQDADNPLMYKFSWSPMGVLSAFQNDAVYRLNNEIIEVHGKKLAKAAKPFVDAWPALSLECLPNRNSLLYEAKYGIPHTETLFRGTLRYRGFSGIMGVFQAMGLLAPAAADGVVWGDAIAHLQKSRPGSFDTLDDFLRHCADGNADLAERAADSLSFLEMSGSAPVLYPDNLVASFCEVLKSKCQYQEGERDMVLMHTSIQALFPEGEREEYTSSLQVYGDSNHSAMSKTVGYTCAAATEVLLNDKSPNSFGLLLPTTKNIYQPVLEAVEAEGIKFKEETEVWM